MHGSHGAQGHSSQLEQASQRAAQEQAEGGKEGNGGRERTAGQQDDDKERKHTGRLHTH